MADKKVFLPKSFSELLRIYRDYPSAFLLAGGTAVSREHRGSGMIHLPDIVIHIDRIPELKRISRSERYFELGAGVPISRLLKVGQHVLPKVLTHAMRKIAHPAIRNHGTLGGNLSHQPRRLNTYGPLTILDARIELRSLGKSRWISVHRLYSKTGEFTLDPGEIISRIRVPFVDWNMQFFQKIGDPFVKPKTSLTFSALSDIKKGEITHFRAAFSFLGKSVLQDRELETVIIGKKVPLNEKNRTESHDLFRTALMDLPGDVTIFQKQRALRLLQWYLSALHNPPSELL